jgi:hypothetical protein
MATIERGGNEHVSQPVVMVTKAIEILERGLGVRRFSLALPEFPWLNTISRVVMMLGSLHSPPANAVPP